MTILIAFGLMFALVILMVIFAIYRLLLADRGTVVVPPVIFTELRHDHIIPEQLHRRMQSDRAAHVADFRRRIEY